MSTAAAKLGLLYKCDFSRSELMTNVTNIFRLAVSGNAMLGGVPVPTAWRVLGLRVEERPPAMEVSYEYIE
jgi:hypothetical protein